MRKRKRLKRMITAFLMAGILMQSVSATVYAQAGETAGSYSLGIGLLEGLEDNNNKGVLTSASIALPGVLETEIANDVALGNVPSVITFFDNQGNLNVAYEEWTEGYTDKAIKVQRFDEELKLIDMISFPSYGYSFGNVICDEEGYYYVVLGRADVNKENCETIIVKKYDYQGQYMAECGVKGKSMTIGLIPDSGTYVAFTGGNCSVAINNGILTCNFARQMYNEHQSNYVLYINCETMERIEVSTVPYVSHSLDQRVVATSDGGFLVVNKGDAYPRAFALDVLGNDLQIQRNAELFHFREGINRDYGYNYVYAELGGIIETDKYYVFCGSSERELSLDFAPCNRGIEHGDVRDLFIQIIDKEFEDDIYPEDYDGYYESRHATGKAATSESDKIVLGLNGSEVDYVTWLTAYEDPYYAANPKIVSISATEFVVMWEVRNYENKAVQVYYAIMDEEGNIIQNPIPVKGCKLAGRTDPVYREGKIYWTTCDDNGANIYCVDVSGNAEEWIGVTGLTATENMDLWVDETKQLEVMILPANAADKSVKYVSDNEEVATVDANGAITGVAEGIARISAISKDNGMAMDVCEVSVTQPIQRLNLAVDGAKLKVGETLTHYVDIRPLNATNTVLEWSNSDASVATLTVDGEGFEIKALSEGTTVITVKATDGSGCVDSATITVEKESTGGENDDGSDDEDNNDDNDEYVPAPELTYINVTNLPDLMRVGEVHQFDVEYRMSDDSKMDFVYESNNEGVLTVDNNRILRAVGVGHAQISVKRSDTMETVDLFHLSVEEVVGVNEHKLVNMVAYKSDRMYIGQTQQFDLEYVTTDGSELEFVYSSANPDIITVDNNRILTAVGVGSAEIQVKWPDTLKTVYSFKVTVAEREESDGNKDDSNIGTGGSTEDSGSNEENAGSSGNNGTGGDSGSAGGSSNDDTPTETQRNGWYELNGAQYWYEAGVRQGYDPDNATYRGKEIYDPDSDAWYWLDNVQLGAKTVSKDVYQESLAGDWGDYIGEDGRRYGKWVRYDKYGHMIKGWQYTENGTYFFDLTYGTMAKGYATIEGVEYYFNPLTGILEQTIGGVPQYGWKTIDGKEYWYENYVRQGVSADASYRGKEIYDAESDGWYWLDNVQGGAKAVSKDVYQESSGGKWVRYDEHGIMIKGWQTTENGTYYFDLITGAMLKGWQTIGDNDYYFDENTGVLQ